MNNNILDEAQQYTGPRTCPSCGYQFPFWKFIRRYVRSYGLSTWACHRCTQPIKCDFIKIQFFWLLGLLPSGIVFSISAMYFGTGFLNVIFLMPFLGWIAYTFYYAKFEKQR